MVLLIGFYLDLLPRPCDLNYAFEFLYHFFYLLSLIIVIGSNSLRLIFLKEYSFDFLISINACMSKGACAGTDITIPLPLSMVTHDAGNIGINESLIGFFTNRPIKLDPLISEIVFKS